MASPPRSQPGSIGHLAYKPAAEEGLIPKTLAFVRTQLPAWRDDLRRPHVSSEIGLNSSLCDFLDSRSRSDFPMARFKHEAPQIARHVLRQSNLEERSVWVSIT